MTLSGWKAFGIGDTGALRPIGYIASRADGSYWSDDSGGYAPDSIGLVYEPGGIYTARCERVRGWMTTYPPFLPAPSVRDWHWDAEEWGRRCTCGFYLRKDRDDLMEYLLTYSHPRRTIGFVVGEVLPEGWVAEHKMGLRAEHIRVIAPELVIMQEGPWQPLHQRMSFIPVNSDWKDARVVTWAEWKRKELPWILEKLSASSRSNQRPSPRSSISPLRSQSLRRGGFLPGGHVSYHGHLETGTRLTEEQREQFKRAWLNRWT